MSDLQDHLSLFTEPMRVRLLSLLEAEELGVGELTRITQVPQSTVSRHLNNLRVAGWIRRRSEGTAGLFRMDAGELGEGPLALWALVRDAFRRTNVHEEDRARLQGVLDARLADERSFYGRVNRQWEQLRRELFGDSYLVPTLVSLAPEGIAVADLGCGTGETLAWLAPVVCRVIGVDRERAMLDVAAERVSELPNVDLREGGLEALPLGDGEVDAALCVLVLHHVEALERAFAEMRRVVRRGGKVIIADMIAHDRQEYRQTMGHVHLGFSEATIRDLAEEAGFHLQSWRIVPTPGDVQGPPLFVAVVR